ncbi:MAG: hypothetical protein KDN19_04770 [Verrucomicrobiae bacterium]|nr:hypothetical protein [Verrucomicrobiae bacterium]
MKFILTEESWILSDLDPIEWTFLDRIPEMAAGEALPPQFRQRLLPDPIDVPASERENEEGFLNDWGEYVRPDLESAFVAARDQVSRDLALAAVDGEFELVEDDEEEIDETVVDDEDEEEAGADHFIPRPEPIPARIEVAREASDAWYSALNQARLLMNEAHDLADATERFHWPDGDGTDVPPLDGARLLLLAQYEFYTALQSILIEVMTRNDQEATGFDGDEDAGEEEDDETLG